MNKPTVEEYIADANKVIETLTQYGTRTETPTVKSIVFIWSNAQASWYHWYDPIKRGESVTLDANQFLLPFVSRKFMEEAEKQFATLPLFRNSFEYVWKGKRA